MIRSHCGNNDHPNPQMLLYIFKLMSVYSLVKPIKGGNVQGSDILDSLVKVNEDENNAPNDAKRKVDFILDRILDHGEDLDIIENEINENFQVLQYLSGYVCKKILRFSSCDNCREKLTTINREPNSLISARDRFQCLQYASPRLISLLQILEETIMKQIKEDGDVLKVDTFFAVVHQLQELEVIPLVGCDQHMFDLTKKIINFYITMRMHFLCTKFNKLGGTSAKTKELRKKAKLVIGRIGR